MKPNIIQSPTGNSAGQQAVKQDLESENFYMGTKINAAPSLGRRAAQGMLVTKICKMLPISSAYLHKELTEINI